jgi:hypothetical protein
MEPILFDIALKMVKAGLPSVFVQRIYDLAKESEGVSDFMHLWLQAPDEAERESCVNAMREAVADRLIAQINSKHEPVGLDGPLNRMAAEVHQTAVEHGWWEGGERSLGDQFANFHCELSEAWEEYRDGHPLTEIRIHIDPKKGEGPVGFPIELADLLIRVFDTAAAYHIDLDLAFCTKAAYNKTRPYRHGGKKA